MHTSTQTHSDPSANRLPPQTKFIVGNEACERFSYYGMRSILAGYITGEVAKGGLGQTADTSTSIIHFFIFANYFMPLFGAWLSDKLIGRYYTILYVSLSYCAGHGVLACSDLFVTVGGKIACLCVGLGLIAFGSGGIKPCVSAFMGDQFKPEQGHLLQKAYGAFYWAINFGSFFSFLAIPFIKNHAGYSWAFGVPGIFMAVATLIFWIGTKHYVRIPPTRHTRQPGFIAVFLHAFRNQTRLSLGSLANVSASLALPLAVMLALVFVALNTAWTPKLAEGDLADVPAIVAQLKGRADHFSEFLLTRIPVESQKAVQQFAGGKEEGEALQHVLIPALNDLIDGDPFYATDRFTGVKLREQTSALLDDKPKGEELAKLNRLLLEDALPGVSKSHRMTPFVRAMGWAGLGGVGVWYLLIVGMSLSGRLELPDQFWQGARARHSENEVAAARSVGPILFVFALVPVFWALFDQTNSTWVLQGGQMIPIALPSIPLPTWTAIAAWWHGHAAWPFERVGSSFGAEEMQSVNSLMVMALVPVLTLWAYPRLGRLVTPLRRMSTGFFCAAASYVIVAWLQRRIEAGETLSVAWQLAPYWVLTVGEVLLSTTGLEFAFAEAAPELRSTIMSFWLLTVAFGDLFVVGITKVLSGGAHQAGSVTASRFLLYAGLTAVGGVLFSLVATRYRYRHPSYKALSE